MSDLLTTKLFIPRRRPNSVERTRLTDQLKNGMDHKLTLITAPAGFGKTTLLSEWIPHSERCVTWVSLDEGDNDPARFWSYFIAALRMMDADIGKDALVLLQSPQPPPIEVILTILLNDIAGFPDCFAHVLDDYQIIHSQAVHTALLYFLEHMPPRMHLVIASRTDPPLPLGRLRARDQLKEIRSADLRFTPDETAVFLNQTMGLNLSSENLISLETHTEGWIAGLQLAGLALQGQGLQPEAGAVSGFIQAFTGSHRYIASYLVEEVLSQRPKGTMDFLLQTSILDRLNGPLCDYLLGASKAGSSQNGGSDPTAQPSTLDSQAILEQLERANLFIVPLDEEGKWFRYHHLFADVLRARLQKSQPDKLSGLHRRASEWYEQAGSIPEAVRHALEAGAWERAARLIQQNALAFGARGHIHLVRSWLTALPETTLKAHPILCIFHAGALMHSNRLEDAESLLKDAEGGIGVGTSADQARLILGRVSMVRSNLLRIKGDISGCVELSQRSLDLLPRSDIFARASASLNLAHRFLVAGDVNPESEHLVTSTLESVRATGNVYTTLRGTTLLAQLHALKGCLHRSANIYAEALSGQNGAILLTGIPAYFFGLGDLKREWNQLDESESILMQGVIQARKQIFDGDDMLHGYQSLARLKQVRGDIKGAKAALDEFSQLAQQHHFSDRLLASMSAVQAWLDLMAGNIPAAAQWAETAGIQIDDELCFPREREFLTLARLFLHIGRENPKDDRMQKALQLLDRLRAAAEADGRMGSLIEILGLQAVAFQASGEPDLARKSIEQAVALASPEDYIRTFLDEGEPMRELLQAARLGMEGLAGEYAGRLLDAFPDVQPEKQLPSNPRSSSLFEPLSDRELAVLRMIAAGASNAEIAQTLIIALSTVKRHTGNIYSKFGVISRTQAIARAQQLGLLS